MKLLVALIIISQVLACSSHSSSASQDMGKSVKSTYPKQAAIIYGDNGDDSGEGDFGLSITSILEKDSETVYNIMSSILLVVEKSKRARETSVSEPFNTI